ncbi:hypothetical protein NX059_003687 [Plenodomus lindquistii]|nr:hypothetical protein NX059_003687 [Plenodomus lindquistii]
MTTVAPPRRFKVEPLETTTRSSKDRLQHEHAAAAKPVRKFAPEPIETTTSTNRRFKPEPIETTTTNNRKFKPEPMETARSTHQKFKPEPIETTKKTNRKFAPEPIESSVRSSRQKFNKDWDEQTSPTAEKRPKSKLGLTGSGDDRRLKSASKKPTKRFTPQLIETAQRSRKAGDAQPTLLPSDKTEATPEVSGTRKARILGIPPTPPTNTPSLDSPQNPLFLEIASGIQHNLCPLARRRSYFSSSQHSFRVPDLDPIESSESEASNPPSPTTSPWNTDHSFMYKEATRRRESVDDRSSGYLLELAAKAAEKQLREQALAAFVNSDTHEHVDHFIDREDTEGSVSFVEEADRVHETSFTEVNWELDAMRKYQEQQESGKNNEKERHRHKRTEHIKPSFNPFGNPAGFLDKETSKKLAAEKRDPEMERMRREARPPMLGQDIRFPRCQSPEPSRFDPTQGCDAVRTAMCYLSEQSKAASEKGESLWCGQGNGRQTSTTPSLWSTANSRASSTHGLWGGFCVNGGDKSPRGPSGLLTPSNERANPLSPCPTPAMSLLPPTPPASTYNTTFGGADFTSIDEKLAIEQSITEDFSDDFVTQVYNYLSLGYPSMARPFDEELSKISKISVHELRQDDHLAESRGYIRLGKDGNLKDSEITEETCMRWRALRIYIQEWARQHPNMSEEEFGMGGTAVRKGSWAL